MPARWQPYTKIYIIIYKSWLCCGLVERLLWILGYHSRWVFHIIHVLTSVTCRQITWQGGYNSLPPTLITVVSALPRHSPVADRIIAFCSTWSTVEEGVYAPHEMRHWHWWHHLRLNQHFLAETMKWTPTEMCMCVCCYACYTCYVLGTSLYEVRSFWLVPHIFKWLFGG